MDKELDFNNFIENLLKNKNKLLFIMIASILSSIIYALSATEYYKAYAYILPPQPKHIQPLNVVDADGDLISQDSTAIKPVDVYNDFIMNIQSRNFQKEFFLKNNINKYYDEDDTDKSFENNFHKNLSFKLSAQTTSRDIRSQSFLTVTFINSDPQLAASIINDYINMANKKTSENLVDSVNQLIRNTRNSIIAEIEGRRNLAKKITQDRIKQLEEAFMIAKDLGIVEREQDKNNSQNVILSESKSVSSQTPLYLYGTRSITAEIEVLKKRHIFDPFIPGLRSLEQKAEGLKNISVKYSEVKSAQIDQPATTPKIRFTPKRKLIVLMGIMFGLIISFLYLISLSFINRRNNI